LAYLSDISFNFSSAIPSSYLARLYVGYNQRGEYMQYYAVGPIAHQFIHSTYNV